MKIHLKTMLATFILSTISLDLHAQALISLDHKLENVKIQTNTGQITRNASGIIPAGESIIILKGLPQNVPEQGIQVLGKSESPISFSRTQVKKVTGVAPADGVKEFDEKIKKVQDQINSVNVAISSAKSIKEYINNLSKTVPVSPTDWEKAVSIVKTEFKQIDEELSGLETRKADLTKELNELNSEKNKFVKKHEVTTSEIHITALAEKDTMAELNIIHNIQNVSWSSYYEARLDTITNKMSILHMANVIQNTGENWDNVNVILTNGRNNQNAELRMPSARRLTLTEPVKVMPVPVSPRGGQLMMAPSARASSDTMENSVVAVVAETTERGIAVEYTLPGKISLKSNDGSGRYRINNHSMESLTIRSVVIPSLNTQAFLQAEWKNSLTAPLPRGPLIQFVDGIQSGTGSLPNFTTGENMTMNFGIDERIKASFDIVNVQNANPSNWAIVNRRSVNTRDARITISSGHARPWNIRVLENVPVSSEQEILVTVRADPAFGIQNFNETQGLMGWNLTLNPKEERKLSVGWNVSVPEGKVVYGLTP